METQDNTGLGLIKTTIERVQNENSLFYSALKKLVNSSEKELGNFLNEPKKQNKQILRLLTSKDKLIIEATNGDMSIAHSVDIFKEWIDSNFMRWGLDHSSENKPEMPVDVYKMIGDATIAEMFGSLSVDLDNLYLTQAQIGEFCYRYPNQLGACGNESFFLFKNQGHFSIEFFVARVRVGSRLNDNHVWLGNHGHRVVVPKLAI
jgi:hypothetical protein